MKIITFNCIKCGNEMHAPEETKSVLCGVCGTWNKPSGGLASLRGLMQSGDGYQKYGSGEIFEAPVKNNQKHEHNEVFGEDEDEQITVNPLVAAVSRIFTVMVITFALFGVVSDTFDSPYILHAAVLIVAVTSVFIIRQALKEKQAISQERRRRP